MATKITKAKPETKTAAEAKGAKEIATPTMDVYLAVGKSFSHKGYRFVPNVIYRVPEAFGDFLLSIEASYQVDQFAEAGKKQLGWEIKVPTIAGMHGIPSAAKAGNAIEVGGDLDEELMAHLKAGEHAGEPGSTPTNEDGENENGEGGDEGTVTI